MVKPLCPRAIPRVWEGFDPEENLHNAGSVNVEELPAADTIVVYAPGKEPRRVNADDAAYVDEQLQTTPPEEVDVRSLWRRPRKAVLP